MTRPYSPTREKYGTVVVSLVIEEAVNMLFYTKT